MTIVVGQAGNLHGLPTIRSWWPLDWLRRRREERALARWVAELSWRWCDAAEVAGLAHHSTTPAKISVVRAPQLHSVEWDPAVRLLVEMLPGQVVADFQAQAHCIASMMGVPNVRVEPYGRDLIQVILLGDD